MKASLPFHEQAEFLRESSGSTNIEKTLIKAVKVLALFHIPHYVCGGFAVQEHGYPRFTVEVDLLPGGGKLDPGPLTFPVPTHVSSEPQILTLQSLISSKLSTYIGRGIDRVQDYADVVKLISVNHLPRDYGIDVKVRDTYRKIWDELHK